MMKKAMMLILTLGLATAWADEASHRKLAEEALSLMDVQKNIEKSFEAVKKMQMEQLKSLNMSAGDTEKARATQTEVMDLIQKEFTWDKVKEDYIKIYADTFSEEDLQGLIDFYKGPIGHKFVQKMPELAQRSMAISQKQMMAIMPKIQEITQKANPMVRPIGLGPRVPLTPAPASK